MTDIQYISPEQIALNKNYPFTIGQIRYLLFCRHRNGLKKAVRKVGKRILFRKDLFDEWLDSQVEGKK